jgi:hypothetical protein
MFCLFLLLTTGTLALLPTRQQYQELCHKIAEKKLSIGEGEWHRFFPLEQHFLLSTFKCDHIECIAFESNRTMKCYGGPTEYVNLRYNPAKESFELMARHDLMPNYDALVTFVQCYCAEEWLLFPPGLTIKGALTGIAAPNSNDL